MKQHYIRLFRAIEGSGGGNSDLPIPHLIGQIQRAYNHLMLDMGRLQKEDGWIDVRDGLPEVGQIVDIWAHHTFDRQQRYKSLEGTSYFKQYCSPQDLTGWRMVNMTYYQDEDEGVINLFKSAERAYYRVVCVENGEVTHWRKLPEPPSIL